MPHFDRIRPAALIVIIAFFILHVALNALNNLVLFQSSLYDPLTIATSGGDASLIVLIGLWLWQRRAAASESGTGISGCTIDSSPSGFRGIHWQAARATNDVFPMGRSPRRRTALLPDDQGSLARIRPLRKSG
ncbi:MAG: hypothetical protein U0521_16510 [Anaerolineae bacterium]